ncbi:MAG: 30S ribosome-binding factor RbfA [Polyangiaceae bacterium]|nr:30S ribosome-binding factor RbfA [Polyangiaceae bacterium]
MPRKARVAGEVQQHLQRAVGALRDPRLAAVSVTRVVLSDDLSSARVFVRIAFGPSGDPERRGLMRALGAATGRLRHGLGTELGLRYVPALYFAYDEGPDDARRVAELLEEIARETPRDPEEG